MAERTGFRVKVVRDKVWDSSKDLYSHDIVYIYEKNGRSYQLRTVLEGNNCFRKVTGFLKVHGKKLPGGRNFWEEYYELDDKDVGEFTKFLSSL